MPDTEQDYTAYLTTLTDTQLADERAFRAERTDISAPAVQGSLHALKDEYQRRGIGPGQGEGTPLYFGTGRPPHTPASLDIIEPP